jgi:hypothetical protein
MKHLIRLRPATGTRAREEALAFVHLALQILPTLAPRKRRGTR